MYISTKAHPTPLTIFQNHLASAKTVSVTPLKCKHAQEVLDRKWIVPCLKDALESRVMLSIYPHGSSNTYNYIFRVQYPPVKIDVNLIEYLAV